MRERGEVGSDGEEGEDDGGEEGEYASLRREMGRCFVVLPTMIRSREISKEIWSEGWDGMGSGRRNDLVKERVGEGVRGAEAGHQKRRKSRSCRWTNKRDGRQSTQTA